MFIEEKWKFELEKVCGDFSGKVVLSEKFFNDKNFEIVELNNMIKSLIG